MLEVKDLHVNYGAVHALNGISLHVDDGEIVSLIGANGAGKTTTLRTITGLKKAASGSVMFDGHDLRKAEPSKIITYKLAHVPEGRHIFPQMTVEENLEMGAYADPAGMEETMKDVYKRFPRLDERRRQLAGTLSGGEQQMLAVGRALMAKPKMILMDEPSMGLSPLLVKEIFAIIQEVNKQGITILLVEQNAKMALAISDRAYVLETGNISIEGQRRGSAERPAREESLSGPVRRGWKMYPHYPYFAVAITRTCGSGGGSYIGKQLAKAFNIDLYDRKLLRLASEDSGISEELFAHADENTRKTMLYRVSERVYDGSIIPPESGNFISDENLLNYQAKVLRELLNEESYICVGRAADFCSAG